MFIWHIGTTLSRKLGKASVLSTNKEKKNSADAQVLCGLIKGWLQELKDDMDEPFQARLIFNNNIFGSLNLISCSLSLSANHIIDEFSPCQVFNKISAHPMSHETKLCTQLGESSYMIQLSALASTSIGFVQSFVNIYHSDFALDKAFIFYCFES